METGEATEQPVGKTRAVEQCAEWEKYLSHMYRALEKGARLQDHLCTLSSGIVIVLNVLIVGATDLKISAFVVSIFVVVMSVIKALQMQFKFVVTASEQHEAKAAIRNALVKVREISIEATSTGSIDPRSFKILTGQVEDAIAQCPNYVNVNPPPKVQMMFGSVFGSKTKSSDKDAHSSVRSIDAENKPYADSPAAMTPVVLGSAGAIDAEAPGRGRRVVEKDGSHSAPPGDALAPQPAAPPPHPLGDASAQLKQGVSEAQKLIQEGVLKMMEECLHGAYAVVWRASLLVSLAVNSFTFVELVLNSLIMIFKNLSSLADFSDVVAVFASVNAVMKGIDMKLQLDVKQKAASTAYQRVTTLSKKVEGAQTTLKVEGLVDSLVFERLQQDFSQLISSYSTYMPGPK